MKLGFRCYFFPKGFNMSFHLLRPRFSITSSICALKSSFWSNTSRFELFARVEIFFSRTSCFESVHVRSGHPCMFKLYFENNKKFIITTPVTYFFVWLWFKIRNIIVTKCNKCIHKMTTGICMDNYVMS